MASQLVALAFEGEYTAETMLDTLRELEERDALELEDAVVVRRPAGGERIFLGPSSGASELHTVPGSADPEITQTTYKRGRAAAKGAGIGVLAGWLLGGPIGGAAVGALIGGMRDRGVDDGFVQQVAQTLHSDSSALLLLVRSAEPAAVTDALRPFKGVVLHTELSPAAEQGLRKALANEDPA